MDYSIVRKHLTKPKVIKEKKVKIDFTVKALSIRKNFVVPNKKSYTISKQDYNEILDNDLNAVIKMNDVFNTRSFCSRDYVYKCSAINYVGEYFCRLYGFDGIYIKTEFFENYEDNVYPFTICEDKAKINIMPYPKENNLIDYTTFSCNYLIDALMILSIFKQFQNASNVLNMKEHTYLDEYLCLLHIMNTSLELYSKENNKPYYIYDKVNSLTYYATTLLCQAMIKYFTLYTKNINADNKENFALTLSNTIYKFCYNEQNKPLSLNDLFILDQTIVKEYSVHFNKRDNGKNIISSFNSFTQDLLNNDFIILNNSMVKCLHLYVDDYIKHTLSILPIEFGELLRKVISINGYEYSAMLCKAFTSFCNNDRKTYNIFLKHYLEKVNSKLNIRYLLKKTKNQKQD